MMNRFIILISLLILFASCASRKKLLYFQGKEDISSNDTTNFIPVYRTDDLLSITVSALNMDAVAPFNLPVVSLNSGDEKVIQPTRGYLIDANGMIDFPVLGMLKVAGLNHIEATTLIKEKLREYISNPIVNIRILNFRVTVLGEVKNPGTFTIPSERISLPQALGLAGDMAITGVRTNVLVVRDNNGKRTQTRVDLTSNKIFQSPVYYLHQNDVVYVEPNRAMMNSSAISSKNVGLYLSVMSFITATLFLLSRW